MPALEAEISTSEPGFSSCHWLTNLKTPPPAVTGTMFLPARILHLVDAAVLAGVDPHEAGALSGLGDEELLLALGCAVVTARGHVVLPGGEARLLGDVGRALELELVLRQLLVDRPQEVGLEALRFGADRTPGERLRFRRRGDLDRADVVAEARAGDRPGEDDAAEDGETDTTGRSSSEHSHSKAPFLIERQFGLQKLREARARRCVEDLLRTALRRHDASVHEDNAVRDAPGELHLVRHEKRGHPR